MTVDVVVVTGTDIGVGKTIVTAALAAAYERRGREVCVVKPAQTGASESTPGDADVVARLCGVPAHTFVNLPAHLAPDAAAREVGVELPSVAEHAARIAELVAAHDVVLVEGSGGVLVHLDSQERTVLDLGRSLREHELRVAFVVVCRAGLGTLNHTALTVRAVTGAGFDEPMVVVGDWPRESEQGLAERTNLTDLVGRYASCEVVPAGAAALSRREFLDTAPVWFDRLPT